MKKWSAGILLLCAALAFAGGQKDSGKAGAAAPKSGAASLIGKLEGPEIILDKVPASFKEAPDLAELVKAGKLPPVKERIGQDPLVVKPVHEIGKYGGIWRRGFTGPGDDFNGWRAATGPDSFVFWDYTATRVMPNIARKLDVSADGREFTFHMRRGMKWSDGQPFTADDVMFWFEDMHLNKELNPSGNVYMRAGGKEGTVEKIDAYTVVFKFPEPYWMFPEVVAGTTIFSQSMGGLEGGFHPKHYLKQFHPKYVSKAELDKKVADAKFDTWVNLFRARSNWALNPELPVITPWKTTSPKTQTQWILERNPYSVWVDTEGNQLPYIDKIVMTLAENLEVLNLRAIAGEYDFQARHIDLEQAAGAHREPGQGQLQGPPRHRRLRLGPRRVGQHVATSRTRSWATSCATSTSGARSRWASTATSSTRPSGSARARPARSPRRRTTSTAPVPSIARAGRPTTRSRPTTLLDKVGLTKKDAAGWRLRPDGTPLRLELQTKGGQFLEFTQMAEMMRTHWEKLGIQINVKEVERALGYTREANNETHISLWTNDGSDDFFLWTASGLPTVFNGFNDWFNSAGAKGKEPEPVLKEMAQIFWKGMGTPEKDRIPMGKKFWQLSIDNCIQIGVVGLGAASQGVRVTNVNMGNAPERQYDTPWVKNPAISRPVTFYWKNK